MFRMCLALAFLALSNTASQSLEITLGRGDLGGRLPSELRGGAADLDVR